MNRFIVKPNKSVKEIIESGCTDGAIRNDCLSSGSDEVKAMQRLCNLAISEAAGIACTAVTPRYNFDRVAHELINEKVGVNSDESSK